MHGLEQGIKQMANFEMNQTIRSNAVSMLNGIIDDLNKGIAVWGEFSSSGNTDAKPGAYGGWAGFTIEKKLWEIELEAREKAKGASYGRSSLDAPLIVLAYNKLEEGQSAADKCNSAIDEMKNRINAIKDLIALIKNTKPKKAPAKEVTQKPMTKSKAAGKPASKKSTQKKQAAKKKVSKKKKASTKKATGKKTSKKKATQKKAAKKKTGKKKVAKKKVAKKKAAKKKAASKKAKRR